MSKTLSWLAVECLAASAKIYPVVILGDGWCAPGQCTVQAWLSAGGGWIAAVIAGWTGLIIRRQFAELRLQTRFLVGDDPPRAELVGTTSTFQVSTFRLVNWNRRKFVLNAVKIRNVTRRKSAVVQVIELNKDCKIHVNSGRLRSNITVAGWEDRAAKPPTQAMDIMFHFDGLARFRDTDRCRALFCGHLSGEEKSPIQLSVVCEWADMRPRTPG